MGPEDEVWIIGAFAMGRIRDTVGVVMLLPGRKFLVPGNYDRWSSAYPHRQDRVGQWSDPFRNPLLSRGCERQAMTQDRLSNG